MTWSLKCRRCSRRGSTTPEVSARLSKRWLSLRDDDMTVEAARKLKRRPHSSARWWHSRHLRCRSDSGGLQYSRSGFTAKSVRSSG
ncbi:hypothetical protein M6B38_389375 [Iris pallida]|uniref:Uncharacterized protein n=1 Tax=Iris pallida TaxID=29817 RepID=A0AAX6G2L5_IRIPA|nr:hypothetical protein M6B38_389375 [Iris pallida]